MTADPMESTSGGAREDFLADFFYGFSLQEDGLVDLGEGHVASSGWIVADPAAGVVPPGGTQIVTVTYSPRAALIGSGTPALGEYSATIYIEADDTLVGQAVGLPAVFSASMVLVEDSCGHRGDAGSEESGHWTRYSFSQCASHDIPYAGDRRDNPIFGGGGFIGTTTLQECQDACRDGHADEHGRPCVAIEWSSQAADDVTVADCALAWGCDYLSDWSGGISVTYTTPTGDTASITLLESRTQEAVVGVFSEANTWEPRDIRRIAVKVRLSGFRGMTAADVASLLRVSNATILEAFAGAPDPACQGLEVVVTGVVELAGSAWRSADRGVPQRTGPSWSVVSNAQLLAQVIYFNL
eukprot:gene1190-1759_t